jgi:hypothetical protein
MGAGVGSIFQSGRFRDKIDSLRRRNIQIWKVHTWVCMYSFKEAVGKISGTLIGELSEAGVATKTVTKNFRHVLNFEFLSVKSSSVHTYVDTVHTYVHTSRNMFICTLPVNANYS